MNSLDSHQLPAECKSIWQLDFSQPSAPSRGYLGKLLINRKSTCACMVGDDRFIAVLGGKTPSGNSYRHQKSCNKAELYAINCRKSIEIKSTNFSAYDDKSKCIYNEKLHKIIVCDEYGGMESYDINKDEWIRIPSANNKFQLESQQIWISDDNPNILMRACMGFGWMNIFDDEPCHMYIHQVDLRTEKDYNSKLIWSQTQHQINGYIYPFLLRL